MRTTLVSALHEVVPPVLALGALVRRGSRRSAVRFALPLAPAPPDALPLLPLQRGGGRHLARARGAGAAGRAAGAPRRHALPRARAHLHFALADALACRSRAQLLTRT
jgi:hypothetical protein